VISFLKESVRFIGLLRGAGQEVTCTVKAVELMHPEVTGSNYIDYKIERVSTPLPEGRYQLLVNNGVTFTIDWWNERWWPVGPS
jgi:hypothetical protein